MKPDWTKVSQMDTPSTMTHEEAIQEEEYIAQCEAAYQHYAAQVSAYENVIAIEDCPLRKQQLQSLLNLLHEDNK